MTGARQADAARLRTALAGLSGLPRRSVTGARAADSSAAPGARNANRPECRTTRASIHDYLTGRLLPHRRRRLETHLDDCAECIRAFIDVRQVSWTRQALDRRLVADDHRGGRHRRPLRARRGVPSPH
jgi:hypothetical protein